MAIFIDEEGRKKVLYKKLVKYVVLENAILRENSRPGQFYGVFFAVAGRFASQSGKGELLTLMRQEDFRHKKCLIGCYFDLAFPQFC
jgi:hypothetical protein